MPRLGPHDGVFELLLARFRSLIKPQAAVFTKQLPADLESNQLLISIVMRLMKEIGFAYNESSPYILNLLYHRALAIDFISVMKIERPDIIYSFATGDFT